MIPRLDRQRRRLLALGGMFLLIGLGYLGSVAVRARGLFSDVRGGRHGVSGVIHRPDRELGFAAIPGARGEHVLPVGSPIPTQYDEHGFRVPLGEERRELVRPYYLTLGCSYTYGEACEAQEAYSHVLAQQLGGTELNAGVCAYGLSQMLLRGQKLIPEWKPEFVVVQYSPWLTRRATTCFAPTHAFRLPVPYFADAEDGAVILCPPVFSCRESIDFSPYEESGGGSGYASFLLEVGLPLFVHDDWHYLAFRAASALNFVPSPTQRLDVVVAHVYGAIRDLCREHGAKMIVVVLGRGPWPVEIPPELFALEVPILDAQAELIALLPTPDEASYRSEYGHYRGEPPVYVDWHPNPRAHALIAGMLARELDR